MSYSLFTRLVKIECYAATANTVYWIISEGSIKIHFLTSLPRSSRRPSHLYFCSALGVTARYRHLLEDVRCLVPHHKRESKLDPGSDGMARAVNDICEIRCVKNTQKQPFSCRGRRKLCHSRSEQRSLRTILSTIIEPTRSCNTYLFLECRKRQDCYMWMGKPTGPSVKFHVTNVHTMDELRLTGNCMKGSRPIVTFDESFTRVPSMKVLKPLLIDIFGTPRGHPKSKPFIDRIITFYYADNKVWKTIR